MRQLFYRVSSLSAILLLLFSTLFSCSHIDIVEPEHGKETIDPSLLVGYGKWLVFESTTEGKDRVFVKGDSLSIFIDNDYTGKITDAANRDGFRYEYKVKVKPDKCLLSVISGRKQVISPDYYTSYSFEVDEQYEITSLNDSEFCLVLVYPENRNWKSTLKRNVKR